MEDNNALETKEAPETDVARTVVGIRFRSCGKIYTFEVDDIDVAPGTKVVVDSEMGLSMGHVVTAKYVIKKTRAPLKKIIRVASDQDFETVENNRSVEEEARSFCMEKVLELKLPMKIVTTETTLDKKRLIFYFTADGRIDFRGLVRDLASKFKTRIEMRQIGVRDEVKLLGGFGVCGRQTCCSLFLTSFAPITIRMAKQQDLSINQSKLSGICGRLMCCLGYEFRGSSEKTVKAATTEKEGGETVANEGPEMGHTPTDSEHANAGTAKEPRVSGRRKKPVTARKEKKQEGAPPQPERQKEKTGEQAAEEKRHFRRDRRRKKKHTTEKSSEKPAESSQKEAPPADTSGQPGEVKEKGRPFNKRRKFWKKKKQ